MSLQGSEQDSIFLLRYTTTAHHYPVHATELRLMMSKAFTHDPLNTVTRHSRPGNLAGNRHPQSRMFQIIGASQHGKITVTGLGRAGEDMSED